MIFVLSSIVSLTSVAQQTVTIGTGSATSAHAPVYGYYNNSWSAQLYKASEFGGVTGNITEIRFNVSNNVSNYAMTNQKVYLLLTSDTVFSSGDYIDPISAGATLVFDGDFTWNLSGWQGITLINPFYYAGNLNLIVLWENRDGSWASGYPQFYSTSISSVCKYKSNDTSFPNSTGSIESVRANIQFDFSANLQNDLAITNFISPNHIINPSSSVAVSVNILNMGVNSQSGYTVKYSIDSGNTYFTEVDTNTISTGISHTHVFSQTANMTNLGTYQLIAIVKALNDSNAMNDTSFYTVNVCLPLNGTYTIGKSGGEDYNSFNDAINAMSTCGITGPVVFEVGNGTYPETFTINPILGASATNTIVFHGQGQGNTTIEAIGNYQNYAAIDVNGAKHITFDNIGIVNVSGNTDPFWGIVFRNSADSNTVENCFIEVGNQNSNSIGIVSSADNNSLTLGNNANYTTIDSCVINHGANAINFRGLNSTSSLSVGNRFTNNTFFDQKDEFTSLAYQRDVVLNNNEIKKGVNTTNTAKGIYLTNCSGDLKISNNKIKLKGGKGIDFYYFNYSFQGNTANIYNNFISMEPTSGSLAYGIKIYTSRKINFYHNSISITGSGSTTNSYDVFLGGSSNYTTQLNFLNNIYYNTADGYAFYSSVPATNFSSNYNDFYAPNGSFNYLSGDIADLTTWQTTVSKDTNSVNINPWFISSTNLHANNTGINNSGTPLATITTDIDGDTRSPIHPDMGADEFSPSAHNIGISIPPPNSTDLCNLTSVEILAVQIVNYGTSQESSFPVSYQLDSGNIVTENFNGSLAPGDTSFYTFSQVLDLSSAGEHTILVYTALPNDSINSNDSEFVSFRTYASITTLPFVETFEQPSIYVHTKAENNAYIGIEKGTGEDTTNVLIMKGTNYQGWSTPYSLSEAINNNQSHHASAYTCDLNTYGLNGLKFSFDLQMKHSYSENYAWFFVSINDSIIKDIHGDSVWHSTNYETRNLIFNLNDFIGSSFKITLNAYLKNGTQTSGPNDIVIIDNIRAWEPKLNDIGAIDIKSSSDNSDCGLMVDSIYVEVMNYGSNTINSFPVNLIGSYGFQNYNWTNTFSGSLAPDSITKVYVGTINTTENASVNITAFTSLAVDSNNTNDTISVIGYNEVYKPIPYIEDFSSTNSWEKSSDFFQMSPDAYNNLTSAVLAFDYYPTGGSAYNPDQPINFNNSSSAQYDKSLGFIKSNSFMTLDYRIDISQNFDDSLYLYIIPNCGNPVLVYALNNSNIIADGNFHTIFVPLSNYTNSTVKYGIVSEGCGNNSYIAYFDNFGINSSFEYSIGNDTMLCPGESITLNTGLSLDSGYHFMWHGPNINTDDTLASISTTEQGYYWVNVTDNSGFVVTDSIHIGYYPQIQAQFVTNKSKICIGDSTKIYPQFSGVFPMIFSWTDGSIIDVDTMTSSGYEYFAPLTTTQYTILSVTDSASCSINHPDSIIITVIPHQSITINGLGNQYCAEDASIGLSATPLGGTFIGAGISGTTFTPAMAGPGNHSIVYQFIDTNNCINTDTVFTTVFANPIVSIVSNLDSQYCSNNMPVSLFAFPLGGSYTGSGITTNIFDPSLANIGIDTIIYSFTDANNCFNADTISTKVVAAPLVSISTSLNTSYCSNANPINLSAIPTGGLFSGMGITDTIFKPSQAGLGQKTILYSYTDANGCSNYDTAFTSINPLPTVLITSTLNPNYCENSSNVSISAYPSGGSFTGNGMTANVFYPDSAGIGNHEIIYNYTDANGCSNSDTINTKVNALPNVSFALANQICANQGFISLNAGIPSGGVYIGNGVNSYQSIFYPNNAVIGLNKIVYKYTDSLGCENSDTNTIRVIGVPTASFSTPANVCKSDTAIINFTSTVSGAAIYNWNFDNASIISGSNAGPYELKWDTIGIKTISVTVTDSGCISNTAYNYSNVIDAIATASIIGNDSACFGDNILLFANGGIGYSYQWYDTSNTLTSSSDTLAYINTSQTGQYYVKVTNDLGCSAISNNIDIFINQQISSNFTLPAIACKNDMVSINYSGSNSSSAQFVWDFDNGQIASGSGSGPYNIIWNTDSIKTVSLDVMENGCNAGMTTHNIDIMTTPAQITALGNTSFCEGGNVTLSANAGNYSYQWYKDGTAFGNTAVLTTSLAGSYTVEVTDNGTSCSNTSDSVQVTVNTTNFNIAFSASPTSFTIPPFNTIFNNQTPNVNDYYWMWSFGDGNSSTYVNPAHQYMFDGSYTVGVIAQNIATGCFDTLVKPNYISCTGGSANPCNLDATIGNIGGNEVCPGDSVKLYSVEHNANVSYQWLRDGILLAGASDSVYYAKQTGLYQVLLTDTTCSVFSQPFSLIQHTTVSPSIVANGSIVPCTNDSMELFVSTSFNTYQWSNGSTASSIFVKNSGSFIVTVTDNNGCNASSQPYIVNASLLQAPEICIVGIDTATNHNRIVWERQANSLIDSFRIYRESNVAGVYYKIGSQAFSDLSVFEDVNSNPAQQAYRYRITAVDTCGMETPPSSIHKTLHLTINAGLGGVWNLIWTNYEGFNFGSYRIYRGTDSTQMTLLTQIQSNLTSYTDLNPPAGNVYYQIEIMSPHPCYPDSIFTKANVNYNSSRSNTANTSMAPNTGFVQSANNQLSMQIYPNPNKGLFTLEVNSKNSKIKSYVLEVYSTMGVLIHKEEIDAGYNLQKQMHFETLSKGVYFIRLRSKNNILTTRFVVE